jgi:hypothetical protein
LRLTREQFVLFGPVQRQIEFDQPCRSEPDGLPALQDRLDQLGAQEGKANKTASVAAVLMLFDRLVTGQVVPINPAAAVPTR